MTVLQSPLPAGGAGWADGTDLAELALAARFAAFAARWGAGAVPEALARELDALDQAYGELWLAGSRPLGLPDLRARGFEALRRLLRRE